MEKKVSLTLLVLLLAVSVSAQISYKYTQNETYTYQEATAIYQQLAEQYDMANMIQVGESDAGKPIHLFTISKDGNFDFKSIREKERGVLLINNAIHPGEPCGVDASVKLANDLLTNATYAKLLENNVICIIPFYNVGGGLNRSCCSRTNQNGPKEYGFRVNVQNRDLNRDFIKCDTKNARAFIKAYHTCKPDVFIDTHTTNGADFQYTMSLLATQPDKLQVDLKHFMRQQMLPSLYKKMKEQEKEIIPYVYLYNKIPDNGIKDYLETPRYSTGYTTLFNTLGFVTEALKYKPYEDRVEHTYAFLISTLEWMGENNAVMRATRKKANQSVIDQRTFELGWYLDTASFSPLEFKGYEIEYIDSEFGEGEKLMIYNHNKPYTKEINYYHRYTSTYEVDKPIAYIIPQAYEAVIDRFKWNQIEMNRLKNDTVIDAEVYFIKSYKTVKQPYEGHYLHYSVQLEKKSKAMQYYKGDYVVYVNQTSNRYIVETLEPQGMDSFFAWNFFDGILQQKEWYSPFSFEPTAIELLKNDKNLKKAFEAKKKEDEAFAKSRQQQLYYIYTRSPYYEDSHNLYPVGRLVK